MRGISWLAENVLAAIELCSRELDGWLISLLVDYVAFVLFLGFFSIMHSCTWISQVVFRLVCLMIKNVWYTDQKNNNFIYCMFS
jgi:hypothetical protein